MSLRPYQALLQEKFHFFSHQIDHWLFFWHDHQPPSLPEFKSTTLEKVLEFYREVVLPTIDVNKVMPARTEDPRLLLKQSTKASRQTRSTSQLAESYLVDERGFSLTDASYLVAYLRAIKKPISVDVLCMISASDASTKLANAKKYFETRPMPGMTPVFETFTDARAKAPSATPSLSSTPDILSPSPTQPKKKIDPASYHSPSSPPLPLPPTLAWKDLTPHGILGGHYTPEQPLVLLDHWDKLGSPYDIDTLSRRSTFSIHHEFAEIVQENAKLAELATQAKALLADQNDDEYVPPPAEKDSYSPPSHTFSTKPQAQISATSPHPTFQHPDALAMKDSFTATQDTDDQFLHDTLTAYYFLTPKEATALIEHWAANKLCIERDWIMKLSIKKEHEIQDLAEQLVKRQQEKKLADSATLFIILRDLDDGRFMLKRQRIQQIHRDQVATTDQGWRAGNTLRFFKLRIKLDPANGYDFAGPSPSEPPVAPEPSA
ncbi:hypothetical protein AJ78_08039 [Emergomyces pasteurianus Ep9510]|uniref:Uncharacterized protein n=1 Tax=Emergomyces pasteurianus Ep9510 TaxID=1447872 RepID=A0A1J9Q4E0_9EURO|nr:hypothetical protein AJ78_08039 [Emergomyces pasteurianus Ep9510]